MPQRERPELVHLRNKMVEEYVLRRGINDTRVLEVMRKVPRHLFVDEPLWELAYRDVALPIGERQTISQPYTIALTTQSLDLTAGARVLEVGTGSGYQTAILAEIAEQIFSIEKLPNLSKRARKILDTLGYHNVATRVFDGSYGWKDESPFDAILVSAASPCIPPYLLEQLKVGGYLVMPLESDGEQQLIRLQQTTEGWNREDLEACRFVPLTGVSQRQI